MKTIKHKVQDEYGFHARPVSQMVEICQKAASEVKLEANGKQSDMKRLFHVLELGVCQGEEIVITIEGEDEDTLYGELQNYIEINRV